MAPINKMYDFLVIGGGSGGVASARRASKYGKKVAVIEGGRLGGTCVNVGCVPKKIMWSTADTADRIRESRDYGFATPADVAFNWAEVKHKRDEYVRKLNGIYEKNLLNESVEYIPGWAKFVSPSEVEVDHLDGSGKRLYSAQHILIAVGGTPTVPIGEGYEHGITSDGFFELSAQPKRVALVGAGYIAIEFAGIFNALGSQTHLFIRHDKFLRTFDPMIQDVIMDNYEKRGIMIHKNSKTIKKVEKMSSGQLKIHFEDSNGPNVLEVDTLMWAVGRTPEVKRLEISKANVDLSDDGYIKVDEFQNTSSENIHALGDVCGEYQLTPGKYFH